MSDHSHAPEIEATCVDGQSGQAVDRHPYVLQRSRPTAATLADSSIPDIPCCVTPRCEIRGDEFYLLATIGGTPEPSMDGAHDGPSAARSGKMQIARLTLGVRISKCLLHFRTASLSPSPISRDPQARRCQIATLLVGSSVRCARDTS